MSGKATFVTAVFAVVFSIFGWCTNASAAASASSMLGKTPAQIHSRLTLVIEFNLQRDPSVVNRLTDQEVADLAYVYGSANDGDFDTLSETFARKLSPAALARLAPYFGMENMRRAVESYAKPSVAQSYATLVSRSPGWKADVSASLINPTAAPTIDMTPYEIYLEFRTAPIGSLTPASALAETGMFMASRLAPSAYLGWKVGGEINDLIETYDPELEDTIGGTIDTALDNINGASSDLVQGKYERALDHLFGGSISDEGNSTGDYSGDFDVSRSYDEYMDDDDDKCDPRLEHCR
jgi:hypothetical protein